MDLVKLLHSSVHQICIVYREGCGGFLVSFEKGKKTTRLKKPEAIDYSHCVVVVDPHSSERRNAFHHVT